MSPAAPTPQPPGFLRVWRPRLAPQLELVLAQNIAYSGLLHVHDELELGFAPLHPTEMQVRTGRHRVPVGAVTVILPGEAHRAVSGPDARRFYGLRVQTRLVQEIWQELSPASPDLPRLSPIQTGRPLVVALLRLHHLSGHAPGLDTLALDLHLRALLALVLSGGRERPGSTDRAPSAMRQARARLDDAPETATSLKELAQEAGLSPFHFARMFRVATGLTPHAYLLDARVRRAKTLLLGDEPLAQLAGTLGFASQSHFTATFRRRTGVTPHQYRQDSRNLVDRERLRTTY